MVRSAGSGMDAWTAGARRFLIFGIVSVGLFLVAVDQTIIATALGALGHDLHARVNWSGWTITVYALGQVIVMPVAGKIMAAALIFTVASLACGLANTPTPQQRIFPTACGKPDSAMSRWASPRRCRRSSPRSSTHSATTPRRYAVPWPSTSRRTTATDTCRHSRSKC